MYGDNTTSSLAPSLPRSLSPSLPSIVSFVDEVSAEHRAHLLYLTDAAGIKHCGIALLIPMEKFQDSNGKKADRAEKAISAGNQACESQ